MRRRTRPRYGRICAVAAALLVTMVAVVGGVGLVGSEPPALAAADSAARLVEADVGALASAGSGRGDGNSTDAADNRGSAAEAPAVTADSGVGKRVVFDLSDQQVWLLDADDHVLRSYPVSGGVTNNLRPGTYTVYSRSRHATGIDGSSMQFFVRFARGVRAAIGFHDIPAIGGQPMQTPEQLGTRQSHGCIRQAPADARRLWRFAPVGTTVVVTA